MKKLLLALIFGIFGVVALPASSVSAQYYDPCTGGTSPYEYGCDNPEYYNDDDGDGVINGYEASMSSQTYDEPSPEAKRIAAILTDEKFTQEFKDEFMHECMLRGMSEEECRQWLKWFELDWYRYEAAKTGLELNENVQHIPQPNREDYLPPPPATAQPAQSSSGWYQDADGMWRGPNGEYCLHEGCC